MSSKIEQTVAPYGTWPSPITAELVSTSSISLHEIRANESNGVVYWLESRPQEKGRFTIVEYDGIKTQEVLPSQHSVHSLVYELGGGSFEVNKHGYIIFSDERDSGVYRLDTKTKETTLILTPEPRVCYADFSIHPIHDEYVLAIKEDTRGSTPETQAYGVINCLVVINARSGTQHTLAEHDDFYGYPRFSPDGTRVCWVQWKHPDMPWTGTELYLADWIDEKLANTRKIAGEWQKESVSQPKWGPDGTLFFASDRSGFWQLYTYSDEVESHQRIVAKGLEESEFAVADWRIGSSTYYILDKHTVLASVVTHATSNIVLLNLEDGSHRDLRLPYVDLAMSMTGLCRVSDESFAIIGGTKSSPKQVSLVSDIRSAEPKISVVHSAMEISFSPDFISQAQHMEVQRTHRPGCLHIFYFPPQHPERQGPVDTKPPGLMQVHGGPNACMSPALDLTIQYWTTRGFAVCAVNYSGSSGFGRAYREELTGYWGLYDVQDVHDAAEFLKSQGLVHPNAVGIYGGSAGGYCTLSAIHMFPSAFHAAVSSYGISDIKALQADSYKFESHDVERLILSSAEGYKFKGRDADTTNDNSALASRYEVLFKDRSPRFFTHNIVAPLLILQGTIDRAVPPEQARMMVDDMRANGRTCQIVEFKGEGHGWRREDTIRSAYQWQQTWWETHLCGMHGNR